MAQGEPLWWARVDGGHATPVRCARPVAVTQLCRAVEILDIAIGWLRCLSAKLSAREGEEGRQTGCELRVTFGGQVADGRQAHRRASCASPFARVLSHAGSAACAQHRSGPQARRRSCPIARLSPRSDERRVAAPLLALARPDRMEPLA